MPDDLVLVVDDDSAVRESLVMLLCADGLQTRAFASGDELLASLDGQPIDGPTCLVTDLRMPGLSGLDLQERLSAGPHAMPVVMVTGQGDVPTAVRALKAGAIDFIEKPFVPAVMLERVHEALAQDARTRGASARFAALTARECEVMDKLLAGCANKVVAIDLGISERTVEQHRARLMHKLEVRSVTELLQLAITAGIRTPG